jgi:demethylmenaquinone methyltransferase/2-methoxy-6-polyprenyl-1,4-benzoquinol methylase
MSKEVKPYGTDKSKKEEVAGMFDSIAGNYDFLNHFLSLGIDILWRKKAVRMLKPFAPKQIVDIATGTGDFALETLSLKPTRVVGVDISNGMLEVGRRKMIKKGVSGIVEMTYGDSENLPFEDHTFDALTVAFGVRNFQNLEAGLKEMSRVLKPGSPAAVIEFSTPQTFPIKQLYLFYFHKILPALGKLVSKDARAYTYLPESVEAFPYGEKFAGIMKSCGFSEVKVVPLTFGIASIYFGKK